MATYWALLTLETSSSRSLSAGDFSQTAFDLWKKRSCLAEMLVDVTGLQWRIGWGDVKTAARAEVGREWLDAEASGERQSKRRTRRQNCSAWYSKSAQDSDEGGVRGRRRCLSRAPSAAPAVWLSRLKEPNNAAISSLPQKAIGGGERCVESSGRVTGRQGRRPASGKHGIGEDGERWCRPGTTSALEHEHRVQHQHRRQRHQHFPAWSVGGGGAAREGWLGPGGGGRWRCGGRNGAR